MATNTNSDLIRAYKTAQSGAVSTAPPKATTLPGTGAAPTMTTLPGTGSAAQSVNLPRVISTPQTAKTATGSSSTGSTGATSAPVSTYSATPTAGSSSASTGTPAAGTTGATATGPDWAYIMNSVSDPYLKALAEQQRNAKIDAQGLNYAKTNDYAQYLGGDFSTMSADQLNTLSSQLSGAWGGASPETQRQLHDYKSKVMSALDALNGTTSTYDPFTGTWTTEYNNSASGGPSFGAGPSQLYNGTSAADYINSLYAAQQDAALQALKSAYEQNMNATDFAASQIPAQYQMQRNGIAAQGEVERANMNEMFAAQGLNNGAAGQMQLSHSNQMLGDINANRTAEANAMAQVEFERLQLKTQYQNAVAQAIADGDMEKANALYSDYIRLDNNAVENAYRAAQLQYNYDALAAQQAMSEQEAAAQAAYRDAQMKYNYDALAQNQAQHEDELALNYQKMLASAAGSRATGSYGGTGGGTANAQTGSDLLSGMLSAGDRNAAILYLIQNGITEDKYPATYYEYLRQFDTANEASQKREATTAELSRRIGIGESSEAIADDIAKNLVVGNITPEQAAKLTTMLEYNQNRNVG